MKLRSPVRRPDAGRDGDHDRPKHNACYSHGLDKRRNFAEVVDIRVENPRAGQAIDQLFDIIEVVNDQKPFDHARPTAHDAESQPIGKEDAANTAR